MADRRASSLPPCPFWSEREQDNHALEVMRPSFLEAAAEPVPEDSWSPKPLENRSSDRSGGDQGTGIFRTPSIPDELNGEGSVELPRNDEVSRSSLEMEDPGRTSSATGKLESTWRRRAQRQERPVNSDELPTTSTTEPGSSEPQQNLEQVLGEEVVRHFQAHAAKLQSQNEMLLLEVQRLKEVNNQQKVPMMPNSWNGELNQGGIPSPPPRKSPQSGGVWASPQTFQCTPGGTRVPQGPPPPDPPPLPAWPPELGCYEADHRQPAKFRGVMGDVVYRVPSGAKSPRDMRMMQLEREVEELQDLLRNQPTRLHGSYWNAPFMTEEQKHHELQQSAVRMRRNAGLDELQSSALREHGDVLGQARASNAQVLGATREPARAHAWQQDLGDLCQGARAHSAQHVHGGVCHGDRASTGMHELGEVRQRGRSLEREHVLGEVCPPARLRSASRGDLAEDGDLKSVPISLPTLPKPDSRDASLDAGDWLIQLEPLIGDLSKNASVWWHRTIGVISDRYSQWLHADPLTRLRIGPPSKRELPAGFERLDQRVTSLLLQAVPASIKNEVVATRELSTAGILYRVFRTYQPGGSNERSKLLDDLTTVPAVQSIGDTISALRLWKRKASRAVELNTQLPDPLLMVRTLDGISKPLDSCQASTFRIATFRMNHSLDVRPTVDALWLYYDLLLAEAETAMHSTAAPLATDPKTPPRAAVKAMQQTPGSGKSFESSSSSPWPCKFWLTESGCRQGQKCRWPHSWDGVQDKASRCWLCSSTQHQQPDCPTKTQARTPVGGDGGGDKDKDGKKGKGKGKTKAKGDKPQAPVKENVNTEDGNKKEEVKPANATTTKSEEGKTAVGGSDKKAEASNSNGTSELLQEATKLLRSLHLPSVKAMSLCEMNAPQDQRDQVLLDSGATHALRRAVDWNEWHQAEETVVALAQGTTSRLRLKPGTLTLLSSPEDGSFGTGILPMGALSSLGFKVHWCGGSCRLQRQGQQDVIAEVINGCPMIEGNLGRALIDELERESQTVSARTALVRMLVKQPALLGELGEVDPSVLLTLMLKGEFPDLPEEICSKVVPTMREIPGDQLPWNRRRRRQIDKAKRIVLHLFSGEDEKIWRRLETAETAVICIDTKLHPQMDLLSAPVMCYLLKIASSGKLEAVIGGPPCRTVSACRYQGDNGPQPLRSDDAPYGLDHLNRWQAQQVEDDAVLLFRMKLLYMVAEHCKPRRNTKVLFGMEQPQDPREYRSEGDIQKFKFMSVWRTNEWKRFQERYDLQMCHFDQGAFGHRKVKPTTFAHNIDGMEQLNGAKAPANHGKDDQWNQLPLQERLQATSKWAAWAPGFKAALLEAIQHHLDKNLVTGEPSSMDSGLQSLPQLRPMTEAALKKWKLHIQNDHQPMRRDCRQCMEAAGRSRPHRRIQNPSSYCLSLDLSGRLKKGKDQFGTLHKYFVVGTYTFPTTKDDLPLAGPAFNGNPEDIPLPTLEEMEAEDGLQADLEDFELPPLDDDAQDPELEQDDGDQQALDTAKASYDNWMKLVEHCQDIKVKTLTFVELIPTRHKGHILEAIAKIYTKIRSLGLDVCRLHADRAKEFTSKVVQQWCYERAIIPTYTSGSDWKANGRAECEVGLIKRHVKTLMKVHDAPEAEWPMIVRHAAERRLRWQLQQVGYPVPHMLPFYTKVLVKRKSWNARYMAWRYDRTTGKIMGPDPWSSLTSGGYCVQLEDGKYLATTDVIVSHPGPGEEQVHMVVEKPEGDAAPPLEPVVRRRLRGKQTVQPQVAMLELDSNSGEDGDLAQSLLAESLAIETENQRLLALHAETAKVLSEECCLIDDLSPSHAHLVPSLAMLATQKYDLEQQLCALDAKVRQSEEEETFLVTKTIQTDQVYREWENWVPAMKSEYQSLVQEKKAVRQVTRHEAKAMASREGIIYEELPSKVVFTRKAGGKHKVRACVCGNFEGPVTASTYAGGCDAAQIRCAVRHGALCGWSTFSTDIKCAFLNAPRQDKSKVVAMTVPTIYVRLGLATPGEVWIIDSAVYGLITSPRDWSDHRDQQVPTIKWSRIESIQQPGVGVDDEGDRRTCQSDRCYRKSLDSEASSSRLTWNGCFVAAADQHLWHLQETCAETGEIRQRGIMAIYVDDVLMSAEDSTATAALEAISKKWECSPVEKATLEKPITFCGFEIQANDREHGGGFRLHQQNYEDELTQKWGISRAAKQIHIKLPMPEDEAGMTKSEDAEAVRQAQAITGALLWLATRTRPEISVAVSAMSRLCTKDPKLTLDIGLKVMEYLKRPTRGLVYPETAGPAHGHRGQLAKPRDEMTIEAYSDISYASTAGYRSVQGQVYYYAGSPVMWNTNRQPFPTQSTAESELVSLCEALVGGRATVALVAAIRNEDEQKLTKRLWGDNAAAITLASGEGQGSWRTRHLRIRAAILKAALTSEEWQLGHLSGKELVADSFTKVVDGLAFERALQDLGIQSKEPKTSAEPSMHVDQSQAKLALLVGSSLVTGAAAAGEESQEDLTWLWASGVILMCVGAIALADKMIRGSCWLWKQLQGTSGGRDEPMTEGQIQQSQPAVRALRQCDEESWALVSNADESEDPAPDRVSADELRTMMAQSRAAQSDPYNKIHGREPNPWVDEEEQGSVDHLLRRATGDQLPRRRRKKKSKESAAEIDDDTQEAILRSAMQEHLLGGIVRLQAKDATITTSPALLQRLMRPSGSAAASGASSSQAAASSSSGADVGASSTSRPREIPSGSSATNEQSATSLRAKPQSGSAAGAVSSERPVFTMTWNQFQHHHKGKHWGTEKMRAEFWKARATGKMSE